MKRSPGYVPDVTGESAVADVAGDSVLVSILSRIEEERERILILAHVGLGISLATLARDLKTDRRELAEQVNQILARLADDEELAQNLGDVRRAGRSEHYQALAFRLNLQGWFCSQCAQFMVKAETGRPRKTCSPRCRRLLHNAGGESWKDQYHSNPQTTRGYRHSHAQVLGNADARHGKLLALTAGLNTGQLWRRNPDVSYRDQALLLVGFTCPLPLSSSDLSALNIDDIALTAQGLELRLYRHARRSTQYVTVPKDKVSALCVVTAMISWKKCLAREYHMNGPLFIWIGKSGRIPRSHVRLGSQAIVNIIERARSDAMMTGPELNSSLALPYYLDRIS
jgi:hypothetical protein